MVIVKKSAAGPTACVESNHSQWQQSFTSDSLITFRGAYFTKIAHFPDIQITFRTGPIFSLVLSRLCQIQQDIYVLSENRLTRNPVK
jgi:hypothetical protein